MKQISGSYFINVVCLLLLSILLLPVSTVANPDEKAPLIKDFIGQVNYIEGRILELASAFPQEKYTWRPADGIRSVSEVYLHMANANYYFIKASGLKLPADATPPANPQEFETSTTDKSEIAGILRNSFSAIKESVKSQLTAQDLDRKIQAFGMEMTVRNFMLAILSHMHEHQGQEIAYARMNGVVPPWSAKNE